MKRKKKHRVAGLRIEPEGVAVTGPTPPVQAHRVA